VSEPRDFRGVGDWHTQAVRAREALLSAHSPCYDVDVTPEGRQLLAEVRGLPGATFADTLVELKQNVREVIILGADLPNDAQPAFTFHYQWPEPGHPRATPDSDLFDDPYEIVREVEGGLTVEECRNMRTMGFN